MVVTFSLILATLLVRVGLAATVWPKNFVVASDMFLVSPSARWNVALCKILPFSTGMETHFVGFSLMTRSLHAASMSLRALWCSVLDAVNGHVVGQTLALCY